MKKIILGVVMLLAAMITGCFRVYSQENQEPEVSNLVLSEICMQLGLYERALEYAEAAIQDDPTSAEAYMQAGIANYEADHNQEAITYLEKAMNLAKKNKDVAANCALYLSRIYTENGNREMALKAVDKGIKIQGDNTGLLLQRAEVLYPVNPQKAEKDIQKAIKTAPDKDYIYRGVALIYADNDMLPEALKQMDKAVSLADTVAINYLYRGMLRTQAGQREGGVRDFVNALNLEPSTQTFKLLSGIEDQILQYVAIAEMDRLSEGNENMKAYEAIIMGSWGMQDRASKIFTELIEQDKAEVLPYLGLIAIQTDEGKLYDALETAQKGLRKYPDDEALVEYRDAVLDLIAETEEASLASDSIAEEDLLLPIDSLTRIQIVDADEVKNQVLSIEDLDAREDYAARGVVSEDDNDDMDKFQAVQEVIVVEPAPVVEKTAVDKVFTAVEQPAEFPGGQDGLYQWLSQNIRYPQEAVNKNIQGRVVVRFIIEKDGSVSDTQVLKGVDPLLDKEALRVMKFMPKWTPGRFNQQAVRSYFTLPITFKIPPTEPAPEPEDQSARGVVNGVVNQE